MTHWLKNPLCAGTLIGVLAAIVIFFVNRIDDDEEKTISPLSKSVFGGLVIGLISMTVIYLGKQYNTKIPTLGKTSAFGNMLTELPQNVPTPIEATLNSEFPAQ